MPCHGVPLPGKPWCLAHVRGDERAAYLDTLRPGSAIDHHGTPFTPALFANLVDRLRDPDTGRIRVGDARFDHARFTGRVDFSTTRFTGDVSFAAATFSEDALFVLTRFEGDADFAGAQFQHGAGFRSAHFARRAWFLETAFNGVAVFSKATFANDATFQAAEFSAAVMLNGALFSTNAWFHQARFAAGQTVGPLVCQGTVGLARAAFSDTVTAEMAAAEVNCAHATWQAGATLRLRYATLDLADAVVVAPVAVGSYPARFLDDTSHTLDEGVLADRAPRARVTSLRGVDAAKIVLTDVDLSVCEFAGVFNLDQLRLEGAMTFAEPPARWRRRGLLVCRWSRRRTLIEEHHWRAETGRFGRGWVTRAAPGTLSTTSGAMMAPARLATTYRALRSALESRGDAPGAADFYYGEMEARRHDPAATRAERALLTAYWFLSGYGLRALRSVGCLAVLLVATVLALMLFGLPSAVEGPTLTGTVQPAGRIVVATDTPPLRLPPWDRRLTRDRLDTAVPIVLTAVVFRSLDANLTGPGVYIDMFAGVVEATLVVLAVLAIRGRVKR